ncbi:UNVERIFIED_ORG: hypothetical protein EDC92_12020 [Dietzia maris]|jgi:hypothetical protein|uniref:hypothetical protein n=1 Tax=Dietzia maris TaxID=37915 RepID=UPI001048C5F6
MTGHHAVLVDVDGTVTAETFDAINLDTLTSALDVRYVDCVQVQPLNCTNTATLDAWVDDEGLFNSPPNPVASKMIATLAESSCQMLYGRVLFATGDLTTGESIGLSVEKKDQLVVMGSLLARLLAPMM